MVYFSCVSTNDRPPRCLQSVGNRPCDSASSSRARGFALAGCNANQALNSSGQADLSKIYYPYYNAYDPTKYGQTSGFYAGR